MKANPHLLFSFLLLLAACQNDSGSRSIEAFYFPLDALDGGKVYEYHSAGNPNDPPVFWHCKSLRQGGSQFLLATSYDPEFSPDQFAREERVKSGMLLADFYTFEKDSAGVRRQVRATVEAASVFPFFVKPEKPGVLLTSIRWQPPADSATFTLVRNRQFEKDTAVVFQGKKLPAVKFRLIELVDQEKEGHLELEYAAQEVYAEGVGLFFFKKDISDGWRMAYQLANIYDMAAFEKKFKAKLESPDGAPTEQ